MKVLKILKKVIFREREVENQLMLGKIYTPVGRLTNPTRGKTWKAGRRRHGELKHSGAGSIRGGQIFFHQVITGKNSLNSILLCHVYQIYGGTIFFNVELLFNQIVKCCLNFPLLSDQS